MNEMIIAIDSVTYTIDVTINSLHIPEIKARDIIRKYSTTEVGKVKYFMAQYDIDRLIVVHGGYITEYRR